MKDYKWIMNRLMSMNLKEWMWRLKQRYRRKDDRKIYNYHMPVMEINLPINISQLNINIDRIPLNWENKYWSTFTELDLFGNFKYDDFRKSWNAGFQTKNTWPERQFSPTIEISQRVDIGDIRTNWELNRHYQFAALAKNYYCTSEGQFLDEFKELFMDWNSHNLFLHGVEWTSAMELAIRINSWVYSYAFLKKAGCEDTLLCQIERGILVMTNYVFNHRARFSSANNHLIVEMYSVALVGVLTGYEPWMVNAFNILTEELLRQNYSDGVNKEMSLHYQSFVMEAYGLLWLLMLKNHIEIPVVWKKYLTAMSEFVADSIDDKGVAMEFGDNDGGKILDISGKIKDYYAYVLNLMGCLLDKWYTLPSSYENLNWIIPDELKKEKERYVTELISSRKEGGYTFLRSKDRRVLIGIDHAELGYGSIAAHGHADALSFQMFIDGQPIIVDSGTYNYHFMPADRDYFRSTNAHNTVMINNKEQSEMLGPFMWGKRAKTDLICLNNTEDKVSIKMVSKESSGEHYRTIVFNKVDRIEIKDDVKMNVGRAYLHIAPGYEVIKKKRYIEISNDRIQVIIDSGKNETSYRRSKYSSKYNKCEDAVEICVDFKGFSTIMIQWKLKK